MSVYYFVQRNNDGQIIRGTYSVDTMPVCFAVDFPSPGTWTYSIQAFGDGTEAIYEAEILGLVIKV